MQQTGKPQVAYGASSATSETGDPDARRRSTAGQPLTSSVAGLHTRAGESSAPPQFSPHFSDETVDLVLSEEDRAVVLGEVQRLEVYSLVVQVQGLRLNRSELRHTLYAAFSEEADKIIDIQFMARGCYHVEFASEEAVTKLLAIKEAGVEGAWISFHKWSHNVNVDDILQDQESSMVFTAVFPGLRKEWRNVLPRIGTLLGKVIGMREGQVGGVPAVRLIAPRSVPLPSTITLPNLLMNKSPVVQKIYYQGLPNQCFVCRQFGHLGRDCQKRRPKDEARAPTQPNVNNEGWSTVAAKHVFKPTSKLVKPVLLLEANPYHSLQETEKEVGTSKVEGGFSIPVFTNEQHNSKDTFSKVQDVESVFKVNNQFSNDKQIFLDQVQQIDTSVAFEEFKKKNEVLKVDITHAEMKGGNIVAFTTVDKSSDRVSSIDKHMPVRAHKVTGKEIWSNRRQLRASEDGRKGRDVALTERRVGVQNMNDG